MLAFSLLLVVLLKSEVVVAQQRPSRTVHHPQPLETLKLKERYGTCSAYLSAIEKQDVKDDCLVICEYQDNACGDGDDSDWNVVQDCKGDNNGLLLDDKKDQRRRRLPPGGPDDKEDDSNDVPGPEGPDPGLCGSKPPSEPPLTAPGPSPTDRKLGVSDKCYLPESALAKLRPDTKSYKTSKYPGFCCSVRDTRSHRLRKRRHHRALEDYCEDDDETANLSGECFSATTLVQEEKKGMMLMKDLQVGDKIMAGTGRYETIYAFGHYLKEAKGTFLKMDLFWNNTSSSSSTSNVLEVTGNHLLYLQGSRHPIRADAVHVGHVLQGGGQVMLIDTIAHTDGLFAPLTPSGTLMVNGVKASGYISLQPKTEFVKFQGDLNLVSYHDFLHMLLSPYRMYCSSVVGVCHPDTYSEDGMPPIIAFGIYLFKTLDAMDLPLWLQLIPFVLAVSIGLCCIALEYVFATVTDIFSVSWNINVAVVVLPTLWAWQFWSRKHSIPS